MLYGLRINVAVELNVAVFGVEPVKEAVVTWVPTRRPNERETDASPVIDVIDVLEDTVPPPLAIAQLTLSPPTGFPYWS